MDKVKDFLMVYNPVVSTGVMTLIFCIFTAGIVSYTSFQVGNGWVFLCLVILFSRMVIYKYRDNEEEDTGKTLLTLLPIIVLGGIVYWCYILNVYRQNIIIDNHVSNDYSRFRNIYIVLLFIVLWVINPLMSKRKISVIETLCIFLVSIFMGMAVNILRIILTQFTTDGFQSMDKFMDKSIIKV